MFFIAVTKYRATLTLVQPNKMNQIVPDEIRKLNEEKSFIMLTKRFDAIVVISDENGHARTYQTK